jgi:hypothetical protein
MASVSPKSRVGGTTLLHQGLNSKGSFNRNPLPQKCILLTFKSLQTAPARGESLYGKGPIDIARFNLVTHRRDAKSSVDITYLHSPDCSIAMACSALHRGDQVSQCDLHLLTTAATELRQNGSVSCFMPIPSRTRSAASSHDKANTLSIKGSCDASWGEKPVSRVYVVKTSSTEWIYTCASAPPAKQMSAALIECSHGITNRVISMAQLPILSGWDLCRLNSTIDDRLPSWLVPGDKVRA